MIGTTLNQRFALEKELGRGGMGAVYRARDVILERSVAIKVLKEQTGEEVGRRLRLEAQILARLLHEQIVRLYDFGQAEGLYYFVMEEVDGASFQKRWRAMAGDGRLRVLALVAEALDYAHRQGVVHRDVKPGNVLLTSADRPKLSDFGLSMLAEQAQEFGVVRGTPHYMSPEQAKGGRVDHRADLYSLGVMMYECATGATPFQGPSLAVISHHVSTAPEPPRSRNPGVGAAHEALILSLLAKDPAARPPTGLAVSQAIAGLLAGSEPSASASISLDGRGSPRRAASWSIDDAPATGGSGGSGATGFSAGSVAGASVAASAAEMAPMSEMASVVAIPATAAAAAAARAMIEAVEADPVTLSADERYLAGHYLAYLLGGSRRRGFLRRRPLDPLNADRARLILAMTAAMLEGGSAEAVDRSAGLMELRPDVRPALSPVVVAKYLACRDSAPRRKQFRRVRKAIQEASPYAAGCMTDARGVLNPGLMPQALDDLRKLAPARTEVDDLLVGRWNRVAEVWRADGDFRDAVLRYATRSAARDPASAGLWPEVVYPLIERARWQRRMRSRPEALWDGVCTGLHLPADGPRLDRAIRVRVPAAVVEELDLDLGQFADGDPVIGAEAEAAAADRDADRLAAHVRPGSESFRDLSDSPAAKGLTRLAGPDPVRLTMGDLHALWQEALAALRTPGPKAGHRVVPIGRYRLAVIPSIRGRSAGQVAVQGMPNKQVEMLTPSIRLGGSGSKPIVAAWVFEDDSLLINYVDFRNDERYILWHAPVGQQTNYDDAGSVNSDLYSLGLEAPDQLDRALSKRFRPRNAV